MGESFLNYLIGDFAFALWDNLEKKLICARDHFGVRPFFYVKTERLFLFASTIDALLVHPMVSRQLDQTALGDFLIFGNYLDAELSIYKDIRRLPPAMHLYIDHTGYYNTKAYWKIAQQDTGERRNLSEHVEQFQYLFKQAVSDRIRTKTVAVEMSGGMDSTFYCSGSCRKYQG